VEAGDLFREIEHQRARKVPARGHPVEQRLLIEALHHHDPIEDGAGSAQRQPPVGRAQDRADLLVELGRCPPIERQLGTAGLLAQRRRRIVQVGEPHGPLQLVGLIASEEDDGSVGVDARDRGAAMVGGIGKEGDDGGLVLLAHARAPFEAEQQPSP
jgi:hypothetical protein